MQNWVYITGERDTIQWCQIENRGYLFVYVEVCTSFFTMILTYFCVSSLFDPVPNFH